MFIVKVLRVEVLETSGMSGRLFGHISEIKYIQHQKSLEEHLITEYLNIASRVKGCGVPVIQTDFIKLYRHRV